MDFNIFFIKILMPFLMIFLHLYAMFNKLQKKWHVSPERLLFIITTFAAGGSLCGYAGRKILGLTLIDKGFLWIAVYVLIVSILWPISVLIVSIPLGQFSFFKKYLRNMYLRIRGKKTV